MPPGRATATAAVNACAALLNLCSTSEQSQRELVSAGGFPLLLNLIEPPAPAAAAAAAEEEAPAQQVGEPTLAAASAAKLLSALARHAEGRALVGEQETVGLLVRLVEKGARRHPCLSAERSSGE